MATMANGFASLTSFGAAENVAGSKKKKNNKAKKAAEANGQPAAVQQPSLSSVTESVAALNVSTPANVVVEVTEAKAIYERAAREAKSLSDKAKLWKDWTRQANDRSSKLKYKDLNGTYLDFKQVILKSKALEISIEACLSTGITPEKQGTLAQLLAAFLPADSHFVEALAASLVRLSGLMVEDAGVDTKGAAQRAVTSVITALKSAAEAGSGADASPVAAWLNRVSAIDKEIARQQGLLQKLGVTNKGAITRETTSCAKQLVKLQEEKFDLLQPHNVPVATAPSGLLGASLRSLEELKSVISGHLKEAEGGKAGKSNAAIVKREEEYLQSQAAEVGAQIRALEAQLSSLRSQQAELDSRLLEIHSQGRGGGAWESAGKGKQTGMSAAQYRDELAVVEALTDLVDPSRRAGASAEQVSEVQVAQFDTPVSYASDSEQFLGMALKALADVPTRISFCRQRIDKAAKLAQLGASMGEKMAADNKGQKDEAEKMLADTMRMAEELVATSVQVRAAVHSRADALTRFNRDGAKAVAAHLRNIDTLAAQVQQQYSSILAGPAPAQAAPVPALAAAAPAAMSAGRAPAPAAAAPAPAAAPAAPSGPTYTPPASLAALANAPAPARTPGGRGAGRPSTARPAAAPAAPAAAAPAAAPAAPAAAPRPVSAVPARQWGKIDAPAAISLATGQEMPTLSEAIKGPAAGPGTSADAEANSDADRANRRKA